MRLLNYIRAGLMWPPSAPAGQLCHSRYADAGGETLRGIWAEVTDPCGQALALAEHLRRQRVR